MGFLAFDYLMELSKMKQEILMENGEFDPQEVSSFFQKCSNGTRNPPIFP